MSPTGPIAHAGRPHSCQCGDNTATQLDPRESQEKRSESLECTRCGRSTDGVGSSSAAHRVSLTIPIPTFNASGTCIALTQWVTVAPCDECDLHRFIHLIMIWIKLRRGDGVAAPDGVDDMSASS